MTEENCFEENTKFLSFKGTLGRRNFIVNLLIVEIIESLILNTPLTFLCVCNKNIYTEIISSVSQGGDNPVWFYIWTFIVGIISCCLYFPSIVRRVRDIIGEVNDNRIYMVSSILVVLTLSAYTPMVKVSWFSIISLFVLLTLIIHKGKISSQRPNNPLIKFNWGAFLGTWIWGLFNKVKITLLMLPLLLTAASIPFMLICGLKGNEWIDKTKKYSSVDELHKSQKNQSIIFALIMPVLIIFFIVILFISSGILLFNYEAKHPEFKDKMLRRTQEMQMITTEANFQKIEILDNEYKFYLDPVIFSKFGRKYRANIHRQAAMYVYSKKRQGKSMNMKNDKSDMKSYLEAIGFPIEIMNNTKIYSTFNNEVLVEFYYDIAEFQKDIKNKMSILEFKNKFDSKYKINNNPSLP